MSRIGKLPVSIPAGVTVDVKGNVVHVKGPKGELTQEMHKDMLIAVEDGHVVVKRPSEAKLHKSLHGLTRTLIANMVEGVEKGYSKELEVNGVGYRVAFLLNHHLGTHRTGQLALGSLDGNHITLGDGNRHAGGNGNGHSTNSRHCSFALLTTQTPGLRRRHAARGPSCRS